MEKDVREIVNKKVVVKRYGKTDWKKLHPAIKDVLIDLRLRGDYTLKAREIIQLAVANDDLKTLTDHMQDCRNWRNVPNLRRSERKAGICKENAKLLSCAAELQGEAARKFMKDNKLENFEITPLQQKILFEITYKAMEEDVQKIVNEKDVVELYGKTDWNKLHPAIKEVVIDLQFRGDYTPAAREIIQEAVATNYFLLFYDLMKDRKNWKNVPKDRFQRREIYLLYWQ
ncbi:Hypothetical predicted protein [Paramuricea clavata]|uniref:Uncharacterized protein n=1 Tax=Paramuricea clavata TaxID=317549 RepID=A0A7D9J1D5_PARCT|nr:Hypothetical predicted protein [Paramuricea clavata]